jgi:cell division protease FtsH
MRASFRAFEFFKSLGKSGPASGAALSGTGMERKQRRFSLWYLAAVALALLLGQFLVSAPRTETLSYNEFKALLGLKKVNDILLERDSISGALSSDGLERVLSKGRIEELKKSGPGPYRFVTARVEDPGLVGELESAGIRFSGRADGNWLSVLTRWLVPLALFFLLWPLLVRRMAPRSGLMSIGRSRAKVYMERSTGVSFDDVAGIDEARAELVEIVDFLKNPDRYRRLGGRIPKGVLLVGAPGTGKTLLARAVAGEAKVPFFSLSGSDFVEMFVGVGAARVRDLFLQAQEHAPSIVFIDELDALGRTRAVGSIVGAHEEREQTLNQLLAEMDGFDTRKGVIIIAATNRPEILDPALLRAGRFDRKVVLDRPDVKGREQILKVHARHVKLGADVDLSAVAARTPGFVGADLQNLVNEAALRAARMGKEAVEIEDFDEAIDRILAGLERKSRVMNPKEKERVAHHEAGHSLLAESRESADRVGKISIIPRGVAALGYTRQLPTEDRYLLTRTELLDRIDVLLGGRVAEEIVFGEVSTGCEDDLQRATDLARDMVTRYGMSESLGLAAFEEPRRALFLDIPSVARKEYSEETARSIDAEIRKLLESAHARVRDTLTRQRQVLDALARLLVEKEVVDRQTLVQLIAQSGHREAAARSA